MKKIIRVSAVILAVAFAVIQFIPVPLPETVTDNPSDIIQNGSVSEEVAIILKTSCYDCHSSQTRYPWYSYVAPVSWLVKHDVEEGRDELNFSEWTSYPKRKALKKLDEISEMVDEGEMPLPIYTLIHRNASLSKEQKDLIIEWTKQEGARIIGE